MRPINLAEASKRGLVVQYPAKGICTFSNGSEWLSWAARNCHECRYYNVNVAGADCAFEAAAFLHGVSPNLARLFGWLESAEYPGSFDYPDECPFFRDSNGGDDADIDPDPDPLQLVLIADPTEPAFVIQNAPIEVDAIELASASPSRGGALSE